jgi:hypothetical protein
MATAEQMSSAVWLIIDGMLHPDIAHPLWHDFTEEERANASLLAAYEIRRKRKPADRKAMKLFKSWLTPEQLLEWRRSQCVTITGSEGGRYRIYPRMGVTHGIELHGTRWFAMHHFCYHDVEVTLPKADVALAHLLLITTDESYFLIAANRSRNTSLWDGAWLRRLNQARRERALSAA